MITANMHYVQDVKVGVSESDPSNVWLTIIGENHSNLTIFASLEQLEEMAQSIIKQVKEAKVRGRVERDCKEVEGPEERQAHCNPAAAE